MLARSLSCGLLGAVVVWRPNVDAIHLRCRLRPGSGHVEECLSVSVGFCAASPTHAFFGKTLIFIGSGHRSAPLRSGRSTTEPSIVGAWRRAAADDVNIWGACGKSRLWKDMLARIGDTFRQQ
jgi:hypothetical protein